MMYTPQLVLDTNILVSGAWCVFANYWRIAVTTLSLRLPESLHRTLRERVQREGISINQFITIAVAEKLSALMTEEYLQERASRGSRANYLTALAQVPANEPDEWDRIEPVTPT
jgi:hypothetical protein